MRLLMDSDCLIKITKSGLKELITNHCEVLIPATVQYEVIQVGIAKGLADAEVAWKNVSSGKLEIFGDTAPLEKGDESLIRLYASSQCDAVATDDARLVKRLKTHGVPFILPGLIILKLVESGHIDRHDAVKALERLAEYISADEHATVVLLMEKIR